MSHQRTSLRDHVLAVLALVLLLLLLLLPATAAAHTSLARSVPAAGARVAPGLAELRLWFTERVPVAITRVRLVGPDSIDRALVVRADSADGKLIVAAVPAPLAPGTYRVDWMTGGRDGHPVRGRFRFVVVATAVAPAAGDTAHVPSAPPAGGAFNATLDSMMREQAASPAERIEERGGESLAGYRIARWAEFVGLLVTLGALAFHFIMARGVRARGFPLLAKDASEGARQLALASLVLLCAAAIARVYGETGALAEPGGTVAAADVRALLMSTTWGRGWLLGFLAAVVALVGVAVARRATAGWTAGLVGGLGLAVSPALTGHAAATQDLPFIAVLADVLHVVGAACWLGGLLFVLIAGLPAVRRRPEEERGASAEALLATFHPLARACVPIVLASGLVSSWLRLRSLDALTHTSYGSLLLYKIFIFLFAGLVGLYNWKKVLPRIGQPNGPARLRRSATVELLVGAVVLALTAALVATEPPDMRAAARGARPVAPLSSSPTP